MSSNSPIIYLDCCSCGAWLRGRQWYNRDDGYGICSECINYFRTTGKETETTIKDNYGIEGIHFNVKETNEME